ncbi:MAG: efflux RND transporter periplasmic adaptor subunit, partial [Janthinobacterium lividum]
MTSVPLSAPQAVGPTTASNNRTAIAVTLVVLMALGAAAFWFFAGQGTESTEDAYVDGNVVQITPQTNGTVTAINADSTDMVRAGDVLVSLNPVDASLALQRAQAQLAKSVRQVRGQYSAASQMRASLAQRQSELDRALADMARRAALAKTGAISQEEYIHAQQIVAAAQATLNVAQQQLASSQALVDAPSLSSHPDVMIAAAQVREAFIGAARTELRAPIAGMVTRRSAQVGQRISPGGSLMSVVSLDHVWVSANFKESQLRHLRINQPVTVTADVYGNTVRYRGHVQGLDAGTGSAFSLMPAQNATGNW